MSSMLCRKELGGQVLVHDTDLIESLSVDSNDHIRTLMMSKRRSAQRRRLPRPNTTPSPSRSQSRNMDSSSLIGKTMKVQHWLNEKTVRTLQERSDLESKAARKLYSPLLETEDTFVKDVEDLINQRELTSLRKKEVLHKNWNERVYKPLRKKIIEAMDSNDWPEVDRRKRELHRQYLEFTNEKGHVFLDTMDPEEYYAMALNGHRPAPIKEMTLAPNNKNGTSNNHSASSSSKRSTISQGAVVTSKTADSANKTADSANKTADSGKSITDTDQSENVSGKPPQSAYVEKTKRKQITHVRCRRCAEQKETANRRVSCPTVLFTIPIPPENEIIIRFDGSQLEPQIETRPLHDPLISQGRQRSEEDRTILRCLTGYRYSDRDIEQVKMPAMPLVPLGRHGTDSVRWLQMPLSNIESTPRLASRKRMHGKFNTTDIDFEQWTHTPYNHSAVDKELQIQKKRMYSEDEKPPFPRPVIRRNPIPLKPVQRSVSFQEPLTQEMVSVEPVNQSMQQMSLGVGGD